MKYAIFGATGIEVSRLCCGTMSFGQEADEEMSAKMYRQCRDAGINFFDCANAYSDGRAEVILGKLIERDRDELIITSKVSLPIGKRTRNDQGLSRRHIVDQVEKSLKRLRTDRIDVYFCHTTDKSTALEHTLRTMNDLVRQGKILHVGVSNWSAWQVARANGTAALLGIEPIQVIQPMYNLAKRTAEIEIFPMAMSEKLGIMTYSPLGGGLLTGKYSTSHKAREGRLSTHQGYIKRYHHSHYYEVAERFTKYAASSGIEPSTLAIAWILANPAGICPMIGARNTDQLGQSLAAIDHDMTQTEWKEISDLTPPVPIATDRDEEAS